jgi:two-component system chemotaxis response regulator CheB
MSDRNIVVIGASAGGVEALQTIAKTLPPNFPGSIFVTVHFPEHGTSVLPRILSRVSPIPAMHAVDGEGIAPGRIYVAPPDFHLLLSSREIHLARGPKENGHRPAIDPMFRSAALAFGPRVIGVILTGSLDDGTAGMAAIKRRGGLTVIQDPEEALFPSMPQSVRDNVQVDRVASLKHLARVLRELINEPLPQSEPPATRSDELENELSSGNMEPAQDDEHPGKVSAYGCPDCGGVLWELQDGSFTRFRCRVGHAWTSDALLAQQSDTLDQALWTALRALEESASLSRHIAERHRSRGVERLAERFVEQAESMERRAQVIRDALMTNREVQVNSDAGRPDPRRAS